MRCLWLLMTLLLLSACQTGHYQGPASDHFNGTNFYFPGEKNKPHDSNYELVSLWLAIKSHPWPSQPPKINYPPLDSYPDHRIVITYINHSSVLVQSRKINFLFDPVYSKRASPFQWIGPIRVRQPGIELDQLPPIDVVLISHNHYDHMDLPTLKKLNAKYHPLFIVPLGNKSYLEHYGLDNVIELDWWQQRKFQGATISFLPAKHDTQRWLKDVNWTLWGSFGLFVDGKRIYFAGDSAYADHFKEIRKKWGRPDFAFLPIGAYEPRELTKPYHMNPTEAVQSHLDLQSKTSMGIHWGTFQLGSEPYEQPLQDLARACQHAHIHDNHFFVIKEGVPYYLK